MRTHLFEHLRASLEILGHAAGRSRVTAGQFKWLMPYLRGNWWRGVMAGVLLILTAVINAAIPLAPMVIIDRVVPGRDNALLLTVILALVAAQLARSLISFLAEYQFAVTGQLVQAAVREDLYRHVLRLPFSFFDASQSGYVNARLSEVSSIGLFFGPLALMPILGTLEVLASVVMMARLNWHLTVVALIALPILCALARAQGRGIRAATGAALEQVAVVSTQIQESMAGIQTIKECRAEKREAERTARKLQALVRINVAQSVANALVDEGLSAIIAMVGTLVLWLCVRAILAGSLTVGQYLAFSLYMLKFLEPSRNLAGVYFHFERATAALGRLQELSHQRAEDDDPKRVVHLSRVVGSIAFANVRFSYATRPDWEALRGVSIDIAPGERVALVGPSGSGKTTIVRLLLGMYRPTAGGITIDGRDLSTIYLADIRDRIGVVPQNVFLFDDTLFNNIRYSRPNATKADVVRAAHFAVADEFIEQLPDGYETMVGERGMTLSGGQLQRIGIARALLKCPDVVVFDEPTSQLDGDTERRVLAAAQQLMIGRTSIIVSHRPAPVLLADRVIVLERGLVVDPTS